MSFTNHTPNYNLPQYVGTDKPTFLGDFNNAMSAIDTALHNNEQNAGEGLSELQQAQAALTETQETLTEVQTEVANVSGIASSVNQNVQQALSAANDATTAANSATSQIQPAVTASNQASADAQAAQQVANGNVTTLNELSERVTALENNAITEINGIWQTGDNRSNTGSDYRDNYFTITAPSGYSCSKVTLTLTDGGVSGWSNTSDQLWVSENTANGTKLVTYNSTNKPILNTPNSLTPTDNTNAICFNYHDGGGQMPVLTFSFKVEFSKQ